MTPPLALQSPARQTTGWKSHGVTPRSPVTSADAPPAHGFRWRLMILLALAANLWLYVAAWQGSSGLTFKGTPAPDFDLLTMDGGRVSLDDLRGSQNVFLHFFTLDCAPCEAEWPALREWNAKHSALAGMVFIVRATDRTQVRAYLETHPLPGVVALDDGRVWNAYHVEGAPTTYFLDTQGLMRFERYGGPYTLELLEWAGQRAGWLP